MKRSAEYAEDAEATLASVNAVVKEYEADDSAAVREVVDTATTQGIAIANVFAQLATAAAICEHTKKTVGR